MADLGSFLTQSARDTAQTLLNLGATKTNSENGDDDDDGTPPDESPPPPPAAAMVTPPGMPPSQIGSKPGLIDKVKDPSAHRISEATWKLVDEAKDPTKTEAQEDVRDILNSTSASANTLWMSPTTFEVKIGHLPFKYVAAAAGEDPYHRSYVLFLGDRSAKGDPQAYKVPTEDFKKWGQWRKVTVVKCDLGRE